MKVTKEVAIVLILSLILSTITACGNASAKNDGVRINSDGTVSEIGDSDDDEDSDDAEDGEDSDDETTSDSSESEAPGNDFAEDDNGDSSSSSSASTPSGDYVSDESFWDGDDKFDLKGFLEANGCTKISIINNDADSNFATASAHYGENFISISAGCATLFLFDPIEAGYYLSSNDMANENEKIEVEAKKHLVIFRDTLEEIFVIVYALKKHPGAEDPLEDIPLSRVYNGKKVELSYYGNIVDSNN